MLSLVATAALIAGACSQSGSPLSPGFASADTSFALGVTGSSTPTVTQIKICAVTAAGTFTVGPAVPVGGGSATVASPVTVAAGTCQVVAESFNSVTGVGANIAVNENPANFQTILAQRVDNGAITTFSFTNGGTLFLNAFHGYTLTYTAPPPPPPPGNQGCTPGYWKQSQHFDSWTTYLRTADFDTTFGVNFFTPNLTLLEALENGGGDLDALGRHAVAALLNAASNGVAYPYTTTQVIAIVRGTGIYAGKTVEERKDILEAANTLGCPLN
jgi:hypothetical protein